LIKRGELPNLDKLTRQGALSTVATTTPAQTPVAWSTFATGRNPGGHGIFDFLRRDPRNYLPDLALNRYEQKNAFLPPRAVNLRRGSTVWDDLTAAGVPSAIIRCPCTYPAEPLKGRLLSGMGVPDLRGGLGTSTFYTTVPATRPLEAENVVHLSADPSGRYPTHLIGPRNPKDRSDVRLEIVLEPGFEAKIVVLKSAGTPSELTLREGRWSEWLHAKFKLGMLQTVRGNVRFFLKTVAPGVLELHASPIQFDPYNPLFPISSPGTYAGELANAIGPYHTAGMVEDHAGLSNGRLDEIGFLDQCDDLWAEREAMLLHELDRLDGGLLYCLFDTPDRVQHMLWRHREPDHPANAGIGTSPEMARALEEQYTKGDAVLGKILEAAGDDALVIAMSDHGFTSFQRGVDLNRWLFNQGLLALKPGEVPGESAGDMFRAVDWERTRAYAVGLGGIYLNLAGREAGGIVRPEEAAGLTAKIAQSLAGLEDPERGEVAVRAVRSREELYDGPYAGESPDLVTLFSRGYRVSWGASMGGVGEHLIEDNTKLWSGDHIVDPELVPGMLAMNRPFRTDGARLEDLTPTILEALGVPAGDGTGRTGRSLLS
jgi:predicted AlkP superfamily phosphohydrolase/phosphomutase